jgi:hypothetical protein
MQAENKSSISSNTVAVVTPSKKTLSLSISNRPKVYEASLHELNAFSLAESEIQAIPLNIIQTDAYQEEALTQRKITNNFVASQTHNLKGDHASMPDFSSISSKGVELNASDKSAETEADDILFQNFTDAERNYEVKVPIISKAANKELVYHFTPSISYRALQTPTNFTFGNLLPQEPDNAEKHTPALGLEFGIRVLSPISEKVKFISGIQLNYTSYDVVAYSIFPQMTTVRLSGFNNIQRVSSLRTNGGAIEQDLLNKTLQVSIPLGLQFRLYGNNHLSWNLSTTLQPSYMIDATGYLVTSDFNNYIKAPEFLRRFNVNSGIETFVSWKRGKMIWQAGPSLRYQMLSNSVSAYPVREHLIQYGLKLGLIRRF